MFEDELCTEVQPNHQVLEANCGGAALSGGDVGTHPSVADACLLYGSSRVPWTVPHMRNIQRKNPQNVDVQNNSTQVLPRGFEDFWNWGINLYGGSTSI